MKSYTYIKHALFSTEYLPPEGIHQQTDSTDGYQMSRAHKRQTGMLIAWVAGACARAGPRQDPVGSAFVFVARVRVAQPATSLPLNFTTSFLHLI
ncbi:hypothetical protein EVAR_82533_1 [Eumeta japonica]|uniref:Uncharacterized protein n=1 Tax=Eumeta variegata TaxID=151549 RepID=A0A4C1UWD4_EUMVA|nr:hypothetical protein EVAR_82533_1 [Eumeta japonica]